MIKVVGPGNSDALKFRNDIAIIGIGCRFPEADDYFEYWVNLKYGVDSIQELDDRWDLDKFYSRDFNKPNTSISKWCGKISGIDEFDHKFFNISPREAKNMDPQQRLLMEESWHCIEDSCVPLKELQEKTTSVLIGVMASDYHQTVSNEAVIIDSYAGLGNYNCILANRISFFFGFTGISMAVDSACASSLVAVHQGRRSLLVGESDYVIAGGVNLNTHPWKYISFSKSRMLSPEGRCKTFDKEANGYVPGEGIAVVLMQRLEDAVRDGNHIYGVVKGSAVNHGGTTRSITAPRVEAQKKLILEAYKEAAFSPETVTYSEAHGTGTSLGDPIEIEALTRVFREYIPYELEYKEFEENILGKISSQEDIEFIEDIYYKDLYKLRYILQREDKFTIERLRNLLRRINYITDKNGICKIGSVKTNIGHLEAAAGIAGLIKVLMMIRYKKIPPLVHLKNPNPIINWERIPFSLAKRLTSWRPAKRGMPLRAGVSSFGFGGVNAHILVEEFLYKYEIDSSGDRDFLNLFLISAKSKASFFALVEKWSRYLESEKFKNATVKDICVSLMKGRGSFPYRWGVKLESKQQLKDSLSDVVLTPPAKNNNLCICLGLIPWTGFSCIESLMRNFPLVNEEARKVQSLAVRLGLEDDLSKYREDPWPAELIALFRHLTFMIISGFLSILGLKIDVVYAEKSSILSGLIYTGIISEKDGLQILAQKKNLEDVTLSRPRLPFYDICFEKTIMPFHFNEKYLQLLVEEITTKTDLLGQIFVDGASNAQSESQLGAILVRNNTLTREQFQNVLTEHEETGKSISTILIERTLCDQETLEQAKRAQHILSYYIVEVINMDKAHILSDSQFTFKKYLQEWGAVLSNRDKNIIQMLEDLSLVSKEKKEYSQEKALLTVIIISSLHKLNQKWDLTDQPREEELRFYELIDMVVDGIMPKKLVVELFLDPLPDYKKIKHILNTRQMVGNMNNPYFYIRGINKNIREIKDIKQWYTTATQQDSGLTGKLAYIPQEEYTFLNFGEIKNPAQNSLTVQKDKKESLEESIKEVMLQLWIRGFNFNWSKLYPQTDFNNIRLPLYPFRGKKFWLGKNTSSAKIEPENNARCFTSVWVKRALQFQEGNALAPKAAIIIGNKEEIVFFKETGEYEQVLCLEAGEKYTRNNNDYTANFNNQKDILIFVSRILRKYPSHMLDFFYYPGFSTPPPGDEQQISLFYEISRNLFFLTKALILCKIKKTTKVIIPSENAFHVLQQDVSHNICYGGIAGFARTVHKENPHIKIIQVDFMPQSRESGIQILVNEALSDTSIPLRSYREGSRYISLVEPVTMIEQRYSILDKNKLYLIIGGTGGIGLKVTSMLCENYSGLKVVLLGRSKLDSKKKKLIKDLENKKNSVIYVQGDITDREQMSQILMTIKENYGRINGVIHSGGILEDTLLRNKEWDSFQRVLDSKVRGTWILNQLTRDEPLDFFVVFSSVISIIGNPGQADYSTANSFLDAFIQYRRQEKCYPGKSVGINWTLWEDGGMGTSEEILTNFAGQVGVITSIQGVDLFKKALDSQQRQLIITGDTHYFRDHFMLYEKDTKVLSQKKKQKKAEPTPFSDRDLEDYLIGLFAGKLDCSREEIDNEEAFFDMGIESIMVQGIMTELHKIFKNLSPTLLFEHPNINKLTSFLKTNAIQDNCILVQKPVEERTMTREVLEIYLLNLFAEKLEISPGEIDKEEAFFDMGVESIMIQNLMAELQEKFENLSPTLLFEHSNINLLVKHLIKMAPKGSLTEEEIPRFASREDEELLSLFRQLYAGQVDIDKVEDKMKGLYE